MRSLLSPVLLAAALATLAPSQTPCVAGSTNATFLASANVQVVNAVVEVRLQNGPNPVTLTALELFTGDTHAETSAFIESHDPLANAPARTLAGTAWWVSETPGWQGGELRPAVSLAPFEVFWLVWLAPNGAQLPVERTDPVHGQPHRLGPQGTRNPLVTQYVWKYRLWCGPKVPGQFLVLGVPCGGATGRFPRTLASPSVPTIGRRFDLEFSNVSAGAPAVLGAGLGAQYLGGRFPLPLDLGRYGAPLCSVHVDVLATAATTADAQGRGRTSFALPGDAGLIGRSFFAQWFFAEPAANTLGLLVSSGMECRLGN